jgi:hypothetical protein
MIDENRLQLFGQVQRFVVRAGNQPNGEARENK